MEDTTKPQLTGAWRTSSFSDGGACVELAPTTHGIAVRNSRNHAEGVLWLTHQQHQALIAGAKAGEFDDFT